MSFINVTKLTKYVPPKVVQKWYRSGTKTVHPLFVPEVVLKSGTGLTPCVRKVEGTFNEKGVPLLISKVVHFK